MLKFCKLAESLNSIKLFMFPTELLEKPMHIKASHDAKIPHLKLHVPSKILSMIHVNIASLPWFYSPELIVAHPLNSNFDSQVYEMHFYFRYTLLHGR